MTMRLKGVIVTFEQDFRTDDSESILNAIRCIRGVADITPLDSNHVDIMARIRVTSEVRAELHEAINRVFAPLPKAF